MNTTKQIVILILILISLPDSSHAQNLSYDTNSIAVELRKGANVVIRSENIEFEVSGIEQSRLHVHKIVTVLNEEGNQALDFSVETDKFVSLDDVEIKVYDAYGKTIDKFKKHDLSTIAGVEEFIDDYKTSYHRIKVAIYPVTIETDYQVKYKGTFRYPTYRILKANEGVENSSFTMRISRDLGFRYKEKNIQISPVVTEDGEYKIYTWSVKNLKPVRYEEHSVSFESRYPSVLLAPNRFKLDKFEGDMSSWKNFGLWYNELLNGVDTLSDQQKMFYKKLVKNASTDQEREKIVYDYLQKNFRYVSIQLGIGGYKPIEADITDTKKYGDCKGLSNYLQAVLKCINIKSYLALVNAESNREPVDKEFPSNPFNHVIVCIPGKKDSTWLECTSKTTDFGVLGSFTENRNALLITENGGVLVPTPRSRSDENIIKSYTTIDLLEDGSGKTNTIFTASGEYKQEMMDLKDEKDDDQKQFMIRHWGFKEPDQFTFDPEFQQRDVHLSLNQELEAIPELKTGNKMFLSPSILNLWSEKLPKAENRHQDFYFACPFEKTDTTQINLPDGYGVEALPVSITESCKYAGFTLKCWYDEKNHQVYSTTRIVLNEYKIPASEYYTVKNFFDAILLAYEDRIIIKKE